MSVTKAQLIGNVSAGASFAGIVTATSFVGDVTGTASTATTAGTANTATTAGTAYGLTGTPNLNVGIITSTTGPIIVGSASSTGTASQTLQVTGGSYISGNLGIGTTNPVSEFDLFGSNTQSIVSIAASDINCSLGNYFIDTVNGNKTYTVSGIVTDRVYSFTLEVTHTTGTITWFNNVEWPAATPPTLTTGKTHLFVFITDDGGTRWRGASLVDYTN
jgi:hypothetical protein